MTSRKVVIATGIYPPDLGGPATHAATLVRGLPEYGIRPVPLVFSPYLHLPRGLRHLWFLARLVAAAGRKTVFYALDPVSVGLPVAIASLLTERGFVLRIGGDYAWEQGVQRFGVHDDLDRFQLEGQSPRVELLRRVERWVAARAGMVVVPNRYLQSLVAGWGVPRSKTVIVPNSADLPESIPATRELARASLGVGGPLLVAMGRLVRWKGFEILVDVAAALKPEFPELRLVILGSGPQGAALGRRIRQCNLDGTIRLAGAALRPQALTYLRAADAFVLNSAGEGMSHSILEAMALGTPVITSDTGGTSELIEHGRTGWLVRHNDVGAFTRAIRELLRDPAGAARLAAAANQAAGRFEAESMLKATAAALQAIR